MRMDFFCLIFLYSIFNIQTFKQNDYEKNNFNNRSCCISIGFM
jgi:hypothetical protein